MPPATPFISYDQASHRLKKFRTAEVHNMHNMLMVFFSHSKHAIFIHNLKIGLLMFHLQIVNIFKSFDLINFTLNSITQCDIQWKLAHQIYFF